MEMQKIPELSLYNHQDVIPLSEELLEKFESAGSAAITEVLKVATCEAAALFSLSEVEVSIIDDVTIAEIHLRFMGIPGATDVITFDHGEIHISVETTKSQALEFSNDFERELILYIIHGLLHLAGHEDATSEGQARMNHLQHKILDQVWQ